MTGSTETELTKAEFIVRASEAALGSSRRSGFPPGITVAQAALESAWGHSKLSREAHNYFGIKAHGSGRWIEMPTTEFLNGRVVRTNARFTLYDSMEECFGDRDRLIHRNSCYSPACNAARNAEQFVHALASVWATDPDYAHKILQIYYGNDLDALDRSFCGQSAPPKYGESA